MSEEYRQGYKDGWKDGYEQAKKDTLPITYPNIPPWDPRKGVSFEPTKCPVCGITWTGVMGYVCPNPNCPTRVSCGMGVSTTWANTTGPVASASYNYDPNNPPKGVHVTPTNASAKWVMRPGGRPTQIFDGGEKDFWTEGCADAK